MQNRTVGRYYRYKLWIYSENGWILLKTWLSLECMNKNVFSQVSFFLLQWAASPAMWQWFWVWFGGDRNHTQDHLIWIMPKVPFGCFLYVITRRYLYITLCFKLSGWKRLSWIFYLLVYFSYYYDCIDNP